ncbi:MAG: 2-hydroxychromene-2-carboxylate isomerase [Hyphomicrobiaceae bacterium]
MSNLGKIQFWFSVGSTYTYLTVSRLTEVEVASGISFEWRPFSVRAIMVEQNNIPFQGKPIKSDYMWRDIERRAGKYRLPVSVPAPYPFKEFDLANRVAVLGTQEGWCAKYVQGTYRRWFVGGLEAGSEPNLSQSIVEAGQDPSRVIAAANSEAIGAAYEAATREAISLNVFGAPTFNVCGEIFWGDDRLEDAIAWYQHGKLD